MKRKFWPGEIGNTVARRYEMSFGRVQWISYLAIYPAREKWTLPKIQRFHCSTLARRQMVALTDLPGIYWYPPRGGMTVVPFAKVISDFFVDG
jgi:hypothetical protein